MATPIATVDTSMKNAASAESSPLVLVADDDATLRFLLREALEEAGFEVEEAADGELALDAYQRLQPDIMLLDVMMPRMDGFTTCSMLRGLPGGANLPILMMTGLEDVESIHAAYGAGATDFITKPINYLILGYRVRYMLRARNAMDELRNSEKRLAMAQHVARLGNWEWNLKERLPRFSDEFCHIFGLPPKQLHGHIRELLKRVDPEDRRRVSRMIKALFKDKIPLSMEHKILLPDGSRRIVRQEADIVTDEKTGAVQWIGTVQDITERKKSEEKIIQLAYYDALTELPNRTFLIEHLGYVLKSAERYNRCLAILSLDLDLFKRINDTLGHSAGDVLLKEVANRLLGSVRRGDYLARLESPGESTMGASGTERMVARLGGDEFVVLLTQIRHAEDAAVVARRINALLAKPFALQQDEVFITASAGITIYPTDGTDAEALLKQADIALHHAKELGRNRYQFFTETMNAQALERLSLENRLHRALERGEFELYYQPKVDVQTDRTVGMEALVRWHNPDYGMVSPGEFIPLAEQSGLVVRLGEWVLRVACEQTKAWHDAGLTALCIAVNLSARQFKEKHLSRTVAQTLKAAGLDGRYLELELTEGILMEDTETSRDTLFELKELGVRIALDDFGTGYSSLSYLQRFPIDTLKIDRSFVRDINTDPESTALAAGIIALSKTLKLNVVAEGVETRAQLHFMREHGCNEVQGYYYSPPIPADDFVAWLHKRG